MLDRDNVVIYTSDREGSSRMNIANDLKRYMGLSTEQLITGTNLAQLHGKNVLNLDPDVVPELNRNWRIHLPSRVNVFSPNPEEYTRADLAQIMLAIAGAKTPLIMPSPYCQEVFHKEAQEVFRPSLARSVMSLMPCLLYGMSDEFQPHKANKNLWMAPFNRISQNQKRIREHQQATDYVVAAISRRGLQAPVTHVYLGQGKAETPYTHSYVFHEQPKKRSDYVENCRKSGMFLCTAKFESFGLMYIELLLSGVIGVFVEEEWNRLLIPDYPHKCSMKDLPALALHIYDNYEDCYAQFVKGTLPGLREKFSWQTFGDEVFRMLEEQL